MHSPGVSSVLWTCGMLTWGVCVCVQRSDIIRAAYEPTEEECEWKQPEDEELSVSHHLHPIHTEAHCLTVIKQAK